MFAAMILSCVASCSKGGSDDTPTPALPSASINNVSQNRKENASTFNFTVSLSSKATEAGTIAYITEPGTAVAGEDFTATSGALTIAAGENSGSISIEVTGDSLRTANEAFYVQLSAPVNCTIKTAKGTGTIINENGLYLPVDDAGYTTPGSYPGYTLVWADEFDQKEVNTAWWTFEQGNNNGWGNNELEFYTDRPQNAFVSDGSLIIEARQEAYSGYNYTSARMITKNKKTFKYGRVDIRAKLPKTKGIWPALWMLGNNIDAVSWPACGEIDILELLGQEPNKMYGTLHWGANFATHQYMTESYTLPAGSFYDQFHVFSMEWKANSIQLYVDDLLFYTATDDEITGGTYPFNNLFFFIFNIAVGGNWPGSPDGSTEFPQRMFVDYVRVFQE